MKISIVVFALIVCLAGTLENLKNIRQNLNILMKVKEESVIVKLVKKYPG